MKEWISDICHSSYYYYTHPYIGIFDFILLFKYTLLARHGVFNFYFLTSLLENSWVWRGLYTLMSVQRGQSNLADIYVTFVLASLGRGLQLMLQEIFVLQKHEKERITKKHAELWGEGSRSDT